MNEYNLRILKLLKYYVRWLSKANRSGGETESWFSKLLVRKIEPSKESHSRMLSDKEIIYALHTHNVRPGEMVDYLKN